MSPAGAEYERHPGRGHSTAGGFAGAKTLFKLADGQAPALLVNSITPEERAALELAEFGLWDLHMGCATVCVSCAQVQTCPNVALPQLLVPASRQGRPVIRVFPARAQSAGQAGLQLAAA